MVVSKNALQLDYISIMHCSLPVISLLTCYQKEGIEACTLNPPPPSGHEHFLAHSKLDIGTMAVSSKQSRFELPSCYQCYMLLKLHS